MWFCTLNVWSSGYIILSLFLSLYCLPKLTFCKRNLIFVKVIELFKKHYLCTLFVSFSFERQCFNCNISFILIRKIQRCIILAFGITFWKFVDYNKNLIAKYLYVYIINSDIEISKLFLINNLNGKLLLYRPHGKCLIDIAVWIKLIFMSLNTCNFFQMTTQRKHKIVKNKKRCRVLNLSNSINSLFTSVTLYITVSSHTKVKLYNFCKFFTVNIRHLCIYKHISSSTIFSTYTLIYVLQSYLEILFILSNAHFLFFSSLLKIII